MTARELKNWNSQFPVGTLVLAYPGGRDCPPLFTKIRTEAWLLGSGDAVASVEQRTGGIALTHIDLSTEPVEAHEQMMRVQLAGDIVKGVALLVKQMANRHVNTWEEQTLQQLTSTTKALQDGKSQEEVMRILLSQVATTAAKELETKADKSLAIVAALKQHREGGVLHG